MDNLLEMLTLTAEVEELKANPNRAAQAPSSRRVLDKAAAPWRRCSSRTVRSIRAISSSPVRPFGRVRAMLSDKGQKITSAGPSVPVEIIGMSEAPGAGDEFHAVADERMARELAEQRKQEQKAAVASPVGKVSLRICSARSRPVR